MTTDSPFTFTSIRNYSNHLTVNGFLCKPRTIEEIHKAIDFAFNESLRICLLGGRNSFSDIFLGEGQLHISLLNMNRVVHLDLEAGEITVQPGVRIWEVLQLIMPAGFYLTGVSGNYTDTIGGMISSNSHGKDSWKYANCGSNVAQLKIMNAKGEILTAERNTPLMKAAIGGLGLIGIIVEIKLQLKKLPAFFITGQDFIIPSKNIVDFTTSADFKYIYLDMANPRTPLSLVRTATFDTTRNQEERIVPSAKPTIWGMPPRVFWKSVRVFWNRHTYSICNAAIRAAHSNSNITYKSRLIDYYYPWRKYPNNCMVFSNDSFHEMQNLFSVENFQEALEKVSLLIQKYRIFPLNVNVKWHCAEDFYLSFSGNGLCLLLTFESTLVITPKGRKFQEELMKIVIDLKGITYLSKYSYLTPAQVRTQYPRFEKWLEIKNEVDPQNIFLSDRGRALIG